MNIHQSDSEEYTNRVLSELSNVVKDLEARLSHATKQDLIEMETRLTIEIKSALRGIDLSGLQALLERSAAEAANLVAVSAQP